MGGGCGVAGGGVGGGARRTAARRAVPAARHKAFGTHWAHGVRRMWCPARSQSARSTGSAGGAALARCRHDSSARTSSMLAARLRQQRRPTRSGLQLSSSGVQCDASLLCLHRVRLRLQRPPMWQALPAASCLLACAALCRLQEPGAGGPQAWAKVWTWAKPAVSPCAGCAAAATRAGGG